LGVLGVAGGAFYYGGVYLPAQKASQPILQTAVARRGTIVLSASGTGALQAANQSDLAFRATGRLARLYAHVGDQVKQGDLLAELDNTTQQLKLEQAKTKFETLTSVSAIGAAQRSMAADAKKLQSEELQLEYLLSPDVYYWENEISKYERAAKLAQSAVEAAPADKDAQQKLRKAQDVLGFGQDKLKQARKDYHDYALANFMVRTVDHATHAEEYYLGTPTDADILKARQDVTIARGALTEATNLYAALTGGKVPAHASGTGLIALEQAKLDLQSAQDNLKATQLVAPFSGTVISISAPFGPVSAVPTAVGSGGSTNPVRSTAIMTIADESTLYVHTFVDESDYTKFKVGNRANVVFDALPDQTFSGQVTQVDPALSTSSGSAVVSGLVRMDPASADLLLGMGGSVIVIAAESQNVVVVPVAALHEYSPGKFSVFVMQDGKLMVQPVEVGLRDLVNAEIKSGLQAGDTVSTGLLGTK
jgi:multidrug efflux pump subunit AcrA (membrane-fusion protein)